MRAFEIYLNGRRLCVAGMEQGDLLFSISCGENRHGRSEVGLGMTGLVPTLATVRWQQRSLQMNDQVRIKIVEAKTVDKCEVLQQAPRDARKYEKAYVRRMAKEFGWTIQTKVRKTRKA
jgi:hypothetical protein